MNLCKATFGQLFLLCLKGQLHRVQSAFRINIQKITSFIQMLQALTGIGNTNASTLYQTLMLI
jgi:hypothetical protein